MDARVAWVVGMVCLGLGCDSSGSSDLFDGSIPDGGTNIRFDGGTPAQVVVASKCLGQSGDEAEASIGVDGQGNALVAWPRRVAQESHVITCVLRGGVWQPPLDNGAGTSPVVALASGGAGMLAWRDSATSGVLAARYLAGQLGASTTAVPQAADADLALMPNGDAVLVANGAELRSFHFDAQANAWSPTARSIPVGAGTVAATPRVASTVNGVMAVWEELSLATGSGAMRAARLDSGATAWTSTAEFFDVTPTAPGGLLKTGLDTSPPGHAMVVLNFLEGKTLSASAFEVAAGRWVPQALAGMTPPPLHASGAIDAVGRGWVVWAVQPRALADFEIRARRFEHAWGPETRLLTTFLVVTAAVTTKDDGRTLLLWIEPNGQSMSLLAAIAEPGASFGPAKSILDGFLAATGSLRVATGPGGTTVATWLTMPQGLIAAAIDW